MAEKKPAMTGERRRKSQVKRGKTAVWESRRTRGGGVYNLIGALPSWLVKTSSARGQAIPRGENLGKEKRKSFLESDHS